MKQKPHIGIIYPNYFPEDFGEVVTSAFKHEKLNLYLEREEPKIWSSVEWAIPGIISAYILKPYFEAFLKEAGKDHYNLLKKGLNKLLKLNKNAPVETLTSSMSTKKVDKENTQSKAISIHIEIKDGRKLKLLFDNDLEVEDWTNGLENILDRVQNHYLGFPNDELTLKLEPLEKDPRFQIFAIMNKETKEWEFLDLRTMTANKLKEKKENGG